MTRLIVGSSSARSPCRARRAASMAYATEETRSAITAKANAKKSTERRGVRMPVDTGAEVAAAALERVTRRPS
ncbi:hypothetical protein GCM10022403_085190 [Streptomyces coacervatus]|uniref:Uncharacterized protein n=1 Tax=Streptomyces coacervatus TaxID=647381 RepID=A0ABP7JCD6_9ACTN